MAILKHFAVKNADYGAVIDYLKLQTVCSNVASILNQPSTQKRTKDEHTL